MLSLVTNLRRFFIIVDFLYCSVTFSFFLVGSDGELLDADEALQLLRDSDAILRLSELGYALSGFSSLDATSTEPSREEVGGVSAGVVAGTVVGCVVLAVVIVAGILAVAYRFSSTRRK